MMQARWRLALRWGALGAFLGAAIVLGIWLTRGQGWQADAPSTRLAGLDAEVFFMNVPHLVRRGPPRLVVVRLNKAVALVPHHYTHEGLAGPQTIEQWVSHLQAPIVFNAGQFDEKLQYIGLLKSHGRWISEQRKPAWMGLLLSGPTSSGVWGRIVDLEQADIAVVQQYKHAMQSMMLVDDSARVRVRKSELAACRTIVAEDKQGRLLIMASEGAITLHDLAQWVPQSGLDIVRAMNLDGGVESQLAIHTSELSLTLYGQYGTSNTVFEAQGSMIRYPLPAVIAIEPELRR